MLSTAIIFLTAVFPIKPIFWANGDILPSVITSSTICDRTLGFSLGKRYPLTLSSTYLIFNTVSQYATTHHHGETSKGEEKYMFLNIQEVWCDYRFPQCHGLHQNFWKRLLLKKWSVYDKIRTFQYLINIPCDAYMLHSIFWICQVLGNCLRSSNKPRLVTL